jgi:phospholipid transport system substrate-binding protein
MQGGGALALLGLILVTLGSVPAALAGEPTEQLRADINALYESVRKSGDAGAPANRAIVDRMFDWTAMAESALGPHWRARTPAEREQFTHLFADLFARAYLARVHLVDAKSFEYLGDTVDGDRATVKTKVFTKRGSALSVDYLVRNKPSRRWQIHDVRVETISLVDNYRVQFDSVITRSSYADLVARLRSAAK